MRGLKPLQNFPRRAIIPQPFRVSFKLPSVGQGRYQLAQLGRHAVLRQQGVLLRPAIKRALHQAPVQLLASLSRTADHQRRQLHVVPQEYYVFRPHAQHQRRIALWRRACLVEDDHEEPAWLRNTFPGLGGAVVPLELLHLVAGRDGAEENRRPTYDTAPRGFELRVKRRLRTRLRHLMNDPLVLQTLHLISHPLQLCERQLFVSDTNLLPYSLNLFSRRHHFRLSLAERIQGEFLSGLAHAAGTANDENREMLVVGAPQLLRDAVHCLVSDRATHRERAFTLAQAGAVCRNDVEDRRALARAWRAMNNFQSVIQVLDCTFLMLVGGYDIPNLLLVRVGAPHRGSGIQQRSFHVGAARGLQLHRGHVAGQVVSGEQANLDLYAARWMAWLILETTMAHAPSLKHGPRIHRRILQLARRNPERLTVHLHNVVPEVAIRRLLLAGQVHDELVTRSPGLESVAAPRLSRLPECSGCLGQDVLRNVRVIRFPFFLFVQVLNRHEMRHGCSRNAREKTLLLVRDLHRMLEQRPLRWGAALAGSRAGLLEVLAHTP
mmetsp:Transcript_122522/g.332684  ORF Transcript_122522/g.332684 Transcript_122522/m.332684 type:complete len:550 (+) Transcript_122522:1134-2783(+)